MTPPRSPSTVTSMAYNARTRLGFQILLWLAENRLIDEDKIPADAIKMIRVWADMKMGRKHKYQNTMVGQLVSLLGDVPSSASDIICSDRVRKRIQAEGSQLLMDGYIVIYPIGAGNEWSYRRTLAGDQLLKVTGYS